MKQVKLIKMQGCYRKQRNCIMGFTSLKSIIKNLF